MARDGLARVRVRVRVRVRARVRARVRVRVGVRVHLHGVGAAARDDHRVLGVVDLLEHVADVEHHLVRVRG